MKFIVVFLLSIAVQTYASTKLNLNDVSVLIPLPTAQEMDLLPQPETQAALGELLPKNYVVKYMPMLLQFTDNVELYPTFRAVGFRIDPCFTEGRGPVKCKQQIRVIWQPLKIENDKVTTVDVTLHSFYQLDQNQFTSLVKEMRSLKETVETDSVDGLSLQSNPLIRREGLNSDYYKSLKNIYFKYIGEQNMDRITFMSLFANKTVWFFGGINIDSEKNVSKIIIPRINNGIQQFINDSGSNETPDSFFGRIFPAPKDNDNFNNLLADSSKFSQQNEEDIINFTRASYKFENPALNNPGTLDCVSCHAAQPVRSWTYKNFPGINFGDLTDVKYIPTRNTQNLSNITIKQNQTNVVRAFGYFDDTAVTSQRVINESTEVVNTLESNY